MVPRAALSDAPTSPTCHLDISGCVAFYGYRDLDFLFWKSAPRAPTIRAVGEVIPRRMHENANGLSVIHVMYPGCGVPDQEARAAFRRIGATWREAIACIGVVVEGDSIWMSAWRGVLTGIVAMSPSRRTTCVVPTLEKMADWLPPHHFEKTGSLIGRNELLGALLSARAHES